jgi:hypothetical protein
MRKIKSWLYAVAVAANISLATICSQAVTLEELHAKPTLSPNEFARLFSGFRYVRHAEVQAPEVFLLTRAGDCDDYATLAATVLAAKGYTTRLITVRMREDTHVVCYIEQTKSYLDFNNRQFAAKLTSCGGSIEEVAKKVARSFDTTWVSAAEFTYRDGMKQMVRSVTPGTARPTLLAAADLR